VLSPVRQGSSPVFGSVEQDRNHHPVQAAKRSHGIGSVFAVDAVAVVVEAAGSVVVRWVRGGGASAEGAARPHTGPPGGLCVAFGGADGVPMFVVGVTEDGAGDPVLGSE